MKNVLAIKQRLTDFKSENQVRELINHSPDVAALNKEETKVVEQTASEFLDKLIRHLDSKRPGKSSIGNLMMSCFYRFQHTGVDNKVSIFLYTILSQIVNKNFEGAFSPRLNVKSKEFMDLPDWDPSKE